MIPDGPAAQNRSADEPLTLLILDRDAPEYAAALADLADDGMRLLSTTDPRDLPVGAAAATIALGEPDRVAAALPELSALAWVQSTWAGVTPLAAAAASGVTVTGVKGVFGGQMAEFALACLLDHVVGLAPRRRAQARREWWPAPTGTLAGKTLGVMGTGSIGVEVAARAAAFGLRLRGYSRSGAPREPFESMFAPDRLHDFLTGCDFVVGVLPDTPATRGLLDARALAHLPGHAFLVNVGRGTLLVDDALVAALQAGQLAGAVLDVFRDEPLPAGHPFWDCPGVTVTAHVAARSWPRDIAALFRDNLARFRAGEPLAHRFDPARGY